MGSTRAQNRRNTGGQLRLQVAVSVTRAHFEGKRDGLFVRERRNPFLTQTVNSFCEILPLLLSSIDRKYFFALARLLTCPRISISSWHWSYLVV